MAYNFFRRGQIAGKLSDEGLKQLMERISQQAEKTTVKASSRTHVDSF